MDSLDNKIKTILSSKLNIPQNYNEIISSTLDKLPNKTTSSSKKLRLVFSTVCCSFILVTGIVFAKDIEKIFKEQFMNFGLGKGIDTAIDNGYIGIQDDTTNMLNQYAKVSQENSNKLFSTIDKIELPFQELYTKAQMKNFIITDENLSFEFYFEFDSKINECVNLGKEINGYIDYENSHNIELTDLIILDEENNIVYAPSNLKEEKFSSFCEEFNLDYKYSDLNVFSNESIIRDFQKRENNIGVTLIQSISNTSDFRMKKIKVYFTEISLIPKITASENINQITLNGDWKFEVDVPEYMYNRVDTYYDVVSCSNDNFKINEAKVTDTAFNISLIISDIENTPMPEYPVEFGNKLDEMREKEKNGTVNIKLNDINTRNEFIEYLGNEKYVVMYENYMKGVLASRVIYNSSSMPLIWEKGKDRDCYVMNSKGEKFDAKINDGLFSKFIDRKKCEFNGKFEMTKYNSTDEIEVVLNFREEMVNIKLKKIK